MRDLPIRLFELIKTSSHFVLQLFLLITLSAVPSAAQSKGGSEWLKGGWGSAINGMEILPLLCIGCVKFHENHHIWCNQSYDATAIKTAQVTHFTAMR